MLRIIILLFFVMFFSLSAYAETRYVTDQLVVSLRSDQHDASPLLERLATGMRVEVIDDLGPFLKIKSPTGKIGFARSQYFIPMPPTARTATNAKLEKDLVTEQKRNKELAAELLHLKSTATPNAKVILPQELEKSRNDLVELNKRYQELERGRSETAAIIQERDQLKRDVARLKKTNKPGTFSVGQWASPFQWFLAGGAILLIGWFAGRSSRPKRHF